MAKRSSGREPAQPATTDALDLAMERGRDDLATEVLGKHSRLIDVQIRNERLEHRNKQAMIAFRSTLAIGILLLLAGFGWMVVNARNDRGLVIEALSVPPDLAARGLSGEAVASQLADRLADMDRIAQSFRSPETMTVNWGNDVKIQIPETGVSIGEVDSFLRRALGSQTTIGGAVFRTPQGLRLTVRAGGSGAVEQTGTDATLETMVQKAAEGVFEKTQGYRYSKFLEFTGRRDEAMAVARRIIATDDDPRERAWAWGQVSNLLINTDTPAAVVAAYRGIREDPENPLVYLNGCIAAEHLSHLHKSRPLCATANRLGSDPKGGLSEIGVNTSRANRAFEPLERGDVNQALANVGRLSGPLYPGVRETQQRNVASLLALLHDIRGLRRLGGHESDAQIAAQFSGSGTAPAPQFDTAMADRDYAAAERLSRQLLAFLATNPETPHLSQVQSQRVVLPRLAIALAMGGKAAEAAAVAASTPMDCASCLMARATVAGAGGDMRRARQWADQALKMGAIPITTAVALGELSLRNRQWPQALADADRAVALAPNLADARKLRGDALRRLGRLDDAVRAYSAASRQAPRWGRLYLDWSIAEARRGNREAARKQLAQAAREYLSPADRKVLAAVAPRIV